VLLDHPLHGEGERQRHREREALGNGHHDDGDGLLEDADERGEDAVEGDVLPVERRLALLVPGAAREVARGEHGEDEHRDGDPDLADAGGEALEALLERRRLGLLPGDAAHHLAPGGVRADGGDDHVAVSVDDLDAGREEGGLVGVDVNRVRLAGHAGLVHLQRVALQEDAVGGDDVADIEHHDVAHDDVEDGELLPPAATHDVDGDVVGLVGEPVESPGLAVVADRGNRGDEEDGEEDADAVVPAVPEAVLLDAEAERDGGADEQHQEEDVAERVPHVGPEPLGLPPRVRVPAECLPAAPHVAVVAADAGLRAGRQRGRDPGGAAQAAEAVVALVLDQVPEALVIRGDRELRRRRVGRAGGAVGLVVDLDFDVGAGPAQDGAGESEAGQPVARPDDVGGLPPLLGPPQRVRRRRHCTHLDQVVGALHYLCRRMKTSLHRLRQGETPIEIGKKKEGETMGGL